MSNPSNYGDILIAYHKRGHEGSDEAKGAMLSMRMAGMSKRAVALALQTDHKTVSKVERRFAQTAIVLNKPRIGRPIKLNRAQRRYILRIIRKNLRIK
jgi:transposase